MSGQAAEALVLNDSQGEWLAIVGDRVRLLAEGASTGGRFAVFEGNVAPGAGPPLHQHDREDEAFYVVKGRFRFVLDGRVETAGPGSFVLAPRGSKHAFVNAGNEEGRLLITVTPAGLERAFRACAALMRERSDVGPSEIAAVFEPYGVRFVGPPLDPVA